MEGKKNQRKNSKTFPRTEKHEFLDRKGQTMSNKTDPVHPNQGTAT